MNESTAAAAPADPSAAARLQSLATLMAAVQADPSSFDFFALLRRVDALRPEQPRTGHALRPRQEGLRLAQSPDLDFAPAALQHLQFREGAAPRLLVRFFGLLGPQGPMPLHFTEFVRDRSHHHGDTTLAHFLDLFHHRLLSLFYRAWAQAQPVVHLDRPGDDRYRAWLAACAGTPRSGPALSDSSLAHQAGWFAGRTRHPEALVKVLQQHFGVAAQVEEHVGHWLFIDTQDRSRLGHARNRAERSQAPPSLLGRSANAGSRVWDRQYRFRLHLGPLSLAQYQAFLPGGDAWPALQHWVQLLAGRELQWDLELSLAPAEKPPARLGHGLRLGVLGWLGPARGSGQTEAPAGTPTAAASVRRQRSLRMRPLTSFLTHRLGVLNG
jgi:type VI secretion system protein ImpH